MSDGEVHLMSDLLHATRSGVSYVRIGNLLCSEQVAGFY